MKVLVILIFLANLVFPAISQRPAQRTGKLLKVPRIYNALITTDDDLIPSQAYPAVAPVLRPAISHYSIFVYNNTQYGAGPIPQLEYLNEPQPGQLMTPQREEPPVYTLQAQQRPPDVFDDSVKNNRNPEIPDVPPPPLPVRSASQNSPNGKNEEPQRRPQNYPPPPSVPFF